MRAQVGERLLFHGKKVGSADHTGAVIEVRGEDGAPPYLVRYDDGHEGLVFPGTDCQVHPRHGSRGGRREDLVPRREWVGNQVHAQVHRHRRRGER